MSTDVQVPPKMEVADKQSRRRSKDTEKVHRKSTNFQNKKYKHDHKFRKRSQSSSNGKFFPPYKLRKKDNFICPPTKFLLGGNINDPLNLNSLQDEETNRAMNAVTPKSSPLPTPQHRRGEIEVIIPRDITDPLSLTAGDDDATYEAMLTSPIKRQQKKPKKKRRSHRTSTGPGSGKEDSIEGAKLDETCAENADKEKPASEAEAKKEEKKDTEKATKSDEPSQKPAKRKSDGHNNRISLRKMELKERKADLDKIVSPVIPQPGAWNDRHRFRPPQRTPLPSNNTPVMPKFKESNAKFQYGNYLKYYGYRNPNRCEDVRLKVFEKHKDLFRGKEVLDVGCNSGHVALAIARDFGPSRVVGIDIDKSLIQVARNNIKHYVNCGREDKFFPVSMPIIYGPIDIPGVSEDKSFPHNISFIQGNYVLESDVLLAMEQPQFDVILCLSITKWIQLNWGDAGLKRMFKRMYAQLRPGGVLVLEAQSWLSYKRKNKLTPATWQNYNNIELFPQQFSQYLLSEVGFSKCETIGCPTHQSRGFQRPIKIFIKEDTSFDTPVYSANTSTHESATPKYMRVPHRALFHIDRFNSERFRLPDSFHLQDEFSIDSKDSNSPPRYFPYETPSSVNSPESGFSEGLFPRRYPPIAVPRLQEESDSNSQGAEEPNERVEKEETIEGGSIKQELGTDMMPGPSAVQGSEIVEGVTTDEQEIKSEQTEECINNSEKTVNSELNENTSMDINKVDNTTETESESKELSLKTVKSSVAEDGPDEIKQETQVENNSSGVTGLQSLDLNSRQVVGNEIDEKNTQVERLDEEEEAVNEIKVENPVEQNSSQTDLLDLVDSSVMKHASLNKIQIKENLLEEEKKYEEEKSHEEEKKHEEEEKHEEEKKHEEEEKHEEEKKQCEDTASPVNEENTKETKEESGDN